MKLMNIIAKTKEPPPFGDDFSKEARDFLLCCFRLRPEQRSTAKQLLKHRFLLGAMSLSFENSVDAEEKHFEQMVDDFINQ